MSPPLPVPSKAAIRALRGIALGTSCAIGVIAEDRRRRINTLKTAVANKQKLKAARRYHRSSSELLPSQLDGAAFFHHSARRRHGDEPHGDEPHDDEPHDDGTFEPTLAIIPIPESNNEPQEPSPEVNDPGQRVPEPELEPELEPEPGPSPSPSPSPPNPIVGSRRISLIVKPKIPSPLADQTNTKNSEPITQPKDPAESLLERHTALLRSIGSALAHKEKKGLDRTIQVFMSNIPSIPSSPLLNTWLRLSARLVKECQASDRWEDASQILTAIIGLGPLDETVYFTHEPSSIVEFHLRRPAPETPCSKESLFSAARIFLAKFKKNPHARGTDMERVGKALMLEALSSQHFNLAHRVYWRILGWAEDAEAFTRWAMETYFERKDYKNVLKVFSIHYSRMKITAEHFDGALDCVAASVEALNGLRAEAVLDSFLELECPADTKLRVRWLTTLLRSHWARYQDPYQTAELFRKVGSLMMLNKIDQPQIIYVALVEILVNAGNEELAQSHANRAIREYPDVASTLALKLVLFKAKAGDWDGVIETLHRVQRSQLANPASYDASFIPILKIWAESHSAAETRDFVLLSMRDLGLKFHRFMVTLVANKYGEARDMEGFTAWLQLVSQEGFALDPGFCNSILYNCWATWKFSYPELRMIQKQFEAIIPDFADEVTPRIMSQAVHRERKRSTRTRPKAITVNKMAYSGRSVNKRDIYEAMTQELMNNKPAAAGMIYRRALKYGMPFCGHCLRLAVLAAFRRRPSDSGSALSMIREAHSRGHEISPALSTFIKCEVDAFSGGSAEMIIHMRDIINRLESSRIVVRAEVLTHMAAVCSRIGHHERAIVLCNLARDRLGSSQLCYSRQSFKALATAYTQLMDVSGLEALIDSLVESKFSADKASLLHLKSIGRLVRKAKSSRITTALLEVIENGIYRLTEARFEARTQGKQISQEALRIVGDALVNMNLQKNEAGTVFTSRTGP